MLYHPKSEPSADSDLRLLFITVALITLDPRDPDQVLGQFAD